MVEVDAAERGLDSPYRLGCVSRLRNRAVMFEKFLGVVKCGWLIAGGGRGAGAQLGTDAGFQRVGAPGRLPDRPRVPGFIHRVRESNRTRAASRQEAR